MTSEKSQLKLTRSEETGELIRLVSRYFKMRKLTGAREDSGFDRWICALPEDPKRILEPNILYSIELKPIHEASGCVVIAATPVLFQTHVGTMIALRILYQATVTFGNKKVFFDLKGSRGVMSRAVGGVLEILEGYKDIKYKEGVITDHPNRACVLV